MKEAPRLPLSDLITEAMLHNDRKHLYVEGRGDRAVFEWFLDSVRVSGVQVLEIDCIEITVEDLRRHDLDEGSIKSRVLVLAREFDRALPETTPQILCVVDADFDYILNRIENNRFLAYTDGTALEMYSFSVYLLKRVLQLGFQEPERDPAQVLDTLYGVLKEIFVTRAANEALNLNLEWLPFEKRCKIKANGTIAFDIDKFVRDYLLKNNALAHAEAFSRCRKDLLTRTKGTRWRYVRGHDYPNLLNKYLRGICKTEMAKDLTRGEVVTKMLFVALDPVEMQSMPLFSRIENSFA